jgi:hypothetical protein
VKLDFGLNFAFNVRLVGQLLSEMLQLLINTSMVLAKMHSPRIKFFGDNLLNWRSNNAGILRG